MLNFNIELKPLVPLCFEAMLPFAHGLCLFIVVQFGSHKSDFVFGIYSVCVGKKKLH